MAKRTLAPEAPRAFATASPDARAWLTAQGIEFASDLKHFFDSPEELHTEFPDLELRMEMRALVFGASRDSDKETEARAGKVASAVWSRKRPPSESTFPVNRKSHGLSLGEGRQTD